MEQDRRGRQARTSIAVRDDRAGSADLAAGVQLAPFRLDLSRRFPGASRLDALTLRRSEDAFVDELFLPCVALGAPLLARRLSARLSRRQSRALRTRPADVRGPPARFRQHPLAAGRGRARHDSPGRRRRAADLPAADAGRARACARIEALHRPYHADLRRSSSARAARFGLAMLIDCHSMPSQRRRRRRAATSCSATDLAASAAPVVIVDALETSLKRRGISGPAQQAFRRRLHHRALRRARRGRARRADRDRSRALPGRAPDRPHRTMDGAARRPVRRREALAAEFAARCDRAVWRRSDADGARRGTSAAARHAALQQTPLRDVRRARTEKKEAAMLPRRPESREETPKEGICGRSCRTATISACGAANARVFLLRYPSARESALLPDIADAGPWPPSANFPCVNQRLYAVNRRLGSTELSAGGDSRYAK